MEAWAIPIRFIIASRRLIYHHHILRRENNELVKRIYQEQVRNPTKGDYSELIKDDFKIINEVQDDVVIQNTNTNAYKTHIKKLTGKLSGGLPGKLTFFKINNTSRKCKRTETSINP